MNDVLRLNHYARLVVTCQLAAAPEKNLIGILKNVFGFTSGEINEIENFLTFLRLKFCGLEPTENEISEVVQKILSLRSSGLDASQDSN